MTNLKVKVKLFLLFSYLHLKKIHAWYIVSFKQQTPCQSSNISNFKTFSYDIELMVLSPGNQTLVKTANAIFKTPIKAPEILNLGKSEKDFGYKDRSSLQELNCMRV